MLVYIVHQYYIRNGETQWKDHSVYQQLSNALRKMTDIKAEDILPIVEEENYEVYYNTPTCYKAGRKDDFFQGYIGVEIIKTSIEDYLE